jgi:hypothetical protein
MDLFGSFGYAPPLLSWPSSRPWTLLPSQIWGLFWLPTLSNDWRNGGEVGVEVACEDWRLVTSGG